MRCPLVVVATLAACQPSSQLLVHIDTDAIVPPRAGAMIDPMRPPWLFDRLRADLYEGTTLVKTRDFELDEGLFLDGKASFGVASAVGAQNVSVRLRMFRGDHTIGGQPSQTASLDTTYTLPPLDSFSVVDVTARLATDDVGKSLGPIAPDSGLPGPSHVGSWAGATIVPCSGTAGPEEVCVPGGAYWMGDPLIRGFVVGADADQERLVIVSPFYLDLREITVADARRDSYLPRAVSLWDTSGDPNIYRAWCTFTIGASAQDLQDSHAAMALNCVSHAVALDYCMRQGKTLPSEAQFEFVASGRGLEHQFVWGNDEPACVDAVWGLGGIGVVQYYSHACRSDTLIVGVGPPGHGARDRISLLDAASGQPREVLDLAGNVGEWMLDGFANQNDPFWAAPGPHVDPVYPSRILTNLDNYHSVRSGTWDDPTIGLRAAIRDDRLDVDAAGSIYDYFDVGWRCARPAR